MTLPELLSPRSALRRRDSDLPGLMRPLEDVQRLMESFLMAPLEGSIITPSRRNAQQS